VLRRQDVGHRVVVRRFVGFRGDRRLYSDALGELVDVSETQLTLATAKGTLVVPLEDVHRAKRVPPRRRPTAPDVIALELAADEAWPAPVRERLGDWLLREAEGWTGRANSALPVGDPDRPLEEAVDAVERWYRDRGRQPLVNVPLPLAAPVGAALDARGWSARPLVLVQTGPISGLTAVAPRTPVRLTTAPSDAWLAIAAERKRSLPAAAWHVLTAVHRIRFAEVYDGSTLVAIGRGAVVGRGRWLHLGLIEVVPSRRRRGLARDVTAALAIWAAESGARGAFLQVEERNTAAVALYASMGLTTHHSYLTREAP
jgi:GNAT superfamily N-acetyltransferase